MAAIKITPRPIPVSFNRPKLFSTAYTRRVVNGEGIVREAKGSELASSNIQNTSSFRYDTPGLGVRSTQQIPIDWSKFENHTFFNSAQTNVNVAFDRIINEYPFDGTLNELEAFTDDLTGFEKWVLEQFPKNVGFLQFSGSSHISVKDFAGSEYPSFSKKTTGQKILDPGVKSLTIEAHIFLTAQSSSNEVLFQNISHQSSGDYGYTIGLTSTGSTDLGQIQFVVSSGTMALSASCEVDKGRFNHLTFTINRRPGINRLFIYNNSNLVATSSKSAELGIFGFTTEQFLIGSGTAHNTPNFNFIPNNTFQGALDELRVYHTTRSPAIQKRFAKKNINADENLKLYFKFNEPSGSLGSLSSTVLDSSGNSLHSKITNFSFSLRNTSSIAISPITYERLEDNPILFPGYIDVINLNTSLLHTASIYDVNNPNLITKLIPSHYLSEGAYFEGFDSPEGLIGEHYTGSNTPGTGELGSVQLLSAFLFVWAKFFDEMKIFSDHFSSVLHVDYDDYESAADQFLPMIFKYYGFDVPNFFTNATVEQFVRGENIGVDYDNIDSNLSNIQNQIWRRILVNLQEIIRSKGTMHAVKTLIRAAGINPDTTLRIREFGGPTERVIASTQQFRQEVSTLLDFSGSLAPVTPSLNAQGFSSNIPHVYTNFLSSSRIEVGFPEPVGTFVHKDINPVHGISNNESDGFLLSGSWAFEGLYKFESLLTGSHPVTQSLARIHSTGTIPGHYVLGNLLAISGSSTSDAKVKFLGRFTSGSLAVAPLLELYLTGANLFDGNVWNVSVGKVRSDEMGTYPSSSFFLRVARQHMGDIVEKYVTSTFYDENVGSSGTNLLTNKLAAMNSLGNFIVIGSQSLYTDSLETSLLNSTAVTGTEARFTNFTGKTGHLRVWSKELTQKEWETHVKNFKSLGVSDPITNFNFTTQATGSFERLRVDITTDQPTTESNSSGFIKLVDFSQNGFVMSGSGFEVSTQVIKPETFRYSQLSSRFDEGDTVNKVRVRGYLSQSRADEMGASIAPVYEITPSETPADDTRFTIDFSIVDALNDDIIKMFSELESMDNYLGDPSLLYADDYPRLENLRDVYFNRLIDSVNLRGYFEFFKWFDGSIGMLIEQILPRKTNYLGTNFVIESHALERHKVRYMQEDIYLDEDVRRTSLITVIGDSDQSGGGISG